MPRYICKISHENKDYYLEFSTVVDAPVTYGMSLEDFTEYYREEYGRSAMELEFPDRMKRVEAHGSSCRMGDSAEAIMRLNRAGKGETCMTMAQLIDTYCVNLEWTRVGDGEYGPACPVVGELGHYGDEDFDAKFAAHYPKK